MENKLAQAIHFRKQGLYQKSNEILVSLAQQYPEDASLNYQCAWSFDVLGEESKAVPYYEKAIRLGLPPEEFKGAIIGLGSTYRALGYYEQSKKIFQMGLERFPDHRAMQTFYAMTLYNLNEHHKAMEILLRCLIDTTNDSSILSYREAIFLYSGQLDRTWGSDGNESHS